MRNLALALKILIVVALLGALLWFQSENHRLRERGELLYKWVAEREGDLVKKDQELQEVQTRLEVLQKDLVDERMRREGITEFVEAAAKKQQQQWEKINTKIATDRKPMPAGLRRGLVALNTCLREDGYVGMRFMKAAGIADKTLTGAEMFEHDRNRLGSDFYLADQVTFHLDRAKGEMTMWFHEGIMIKAGQRMTIPAEGYPVVLREVHGPMWERQLPFLIRAEGEYPASKTGKRARPKPLDPVSVGDWLLRLDELTRGAKTHVRYRVDRFRGLENATFKEVLLLGYNQKKVLAESAEAAELQVVVDKKRGTVELLLRDGVLRSRGGKSNIAPEGYRILLLGVTPKHALASMMGMVVQK
ncbi:MAG: hypothetical protein ACYTGW_05810 [Planctomycetota bacterium]|jgi:hypothetical protein